MITEIKALIKKNKLQYNTITKIISLDKHTPSELETYQSCQRFIKGFVMDLEKIIK